MNSPGNRITAAAGVFGALGVALGAFGAHALKPTLESAGRTDVWETAVLYHLLHAVALLIVGNWREATGGLGAKVAWCWSLGIVLFSGSLYWLSLGGPRFLGPITPLGGLAFIAGWIVVIVAAVRRPSPSR
jgi:uncharacterized membrane protein YgdD (TMEM256/DUF423 family)